MKKVILFLCTIVTITTLALSQSLISVAVESSQTTWKQPYTPTYLDWLLVKLNSDERHFCFRAFTAGKVTREAYYQWSKLSDDMLTLTIEESVLNSDSNPKISGVGDCTRSTFATLQERSSELKLNPPVVKLRYFWNADIFGEPTRVWRCNVPAKTDKEDVSGIERICQAQQTTKGV